MEKRLHRKPSCAVLAGVCAGLAEYFEIDVTLIRLVWVLFVALGGSGLLAYILCALIMPAE